jgi:DNA-binding response OmpR family regulator
MEGTILLLEAEPVCMKLVASVLWKAGYWVLEAKTYEEAMRLHAENDGWINLLIADVNSNLARGISAAEMLRQVDPEMAVLFTSTVPVEYWPETFQKKAAGIRGARLLLKPFTPSELREKVRMLIGQLVSAEGGPFGGASLRTFRTPEPGSY